MSLGRRKVGLGEPARWVFNRMVEAYDARPPYPAALVDILAELAGPAGNRICDLGAGIGHLALPLAERGYDVAAVEPARAMLDRLAVAADQRGLSIRALHATAEAVPVDRASFDLVVVADAFHFLDAELAAAEIGRILARPGALAVVTSELGDTPFMRDIVRVIEEAVPRRPRALTRQLAQLAAITGVPLTSELRFHDETPVAHATLERILRSISYIGPAMNPARFAAFRQRIFALSRTPVWGRTFVLRWGLRRPSRERMPGRPARASTAAVAPLLNSS